MPWSSTQMRTWLNGGIGNWASPVMDHDSVELNSNDRSRVFGAPRNTSSVEIVTRGIVSGGTNLIALSMRLDNTC